MSLLLLSSLVSAPAIKSSGISGVLYAAEPLDACSPLTNNVEKDTTSFALIIRGGCTFDDKVMTAQKAGFKAAIVYDNEYGGALVASNVLLDSQIYTSFYKFSAHLLHLERNDMQSFAD